MLTGDRGLLRVTVEGVPPQDVVEEGLDAIDLSLTYEGEGLGTEHVEYIQFKHSSVRPDEPWTASGVLPTLHQFAKRFDAYFADVGLEAAAADRSFTFETNRPIAASLADALADLAAGDVTVLGERIRRDAHINDDVLVAFAKRVQLTGGVTDYLGQTALLNDDTRAYLPDADKNAAMRLRELAARKATSEFASNPHIYLEDVLEALEVRSDDLFPAPNQIDIPEQVVRRPQFADIAEAVLAHSSPTIIMADGGVGKSVAATQLGNYLPADSAAFVYDCFGNGAYRSTTGARHRPQDALVQIANEMATAGFCDPLVPTSTAAPKDYMRAFMARVRQAGTILPSGAILLIVIDAADNAETAAGEANDGPSFARLLLREDWPENARLVLTARPYRTTSLRPPPNAIEVTLPSFELEESTAKLRFKFADATEHEGREFHRLTSANPRVQDLALSKADMIGTLFAFLGRAPKNVGDLIAMSVEKAMDDGATDHGDDVKRVCEALATLRPFVPVDIVARTAEVHADLVRSLASDLGRSVLIREDAIQFRDEPTETWFREHFRPPSKRLGSFVDRLTPIASHSGYVSAVLPQLMLEAGRFNELVALALAGEALPDGDEVVRRDVELQRLLFALTASLRRCQYVDAAKIALAAGDLAATDERQHELFSANADLAARFLGSDIVQSYVSRRLVTGGSWLGSEHAYEAAMLAGVPGLEGDARSRLREAHHWLEHELRRPRGEYERQDLELADLAAMMSAHLEVHGASTFAAELRRWTPRTLSYEVGRLVIARLVDAGRYADIDAIAEAAGNDIGLLLGAARELAFVGRSPPAKPVERGLRLVARLGDRLPGKPGWTPADERLTAVTDLIVAGLDHRVVRRADAARILTRFLPSSPPQGLVSSVPRFDGARFLYLRAYSLRSELRSQQLQSEALVPRSLRRERKKRGTATDEYARYSKELGPLLPWHRLWAKAKLGRLDASTVAEAAVQAKKASSAADSYFGRDEHGTNDEIVRLRAETLAAVGATDEPWSDLLRGSERSTHPWLILTKTHVVRLLGATGRHADALQLGADVSELLAAGREGAEEQMSEFVALTRAVLATSEEDTRAYFEKAISVSARIGQENVLRWDAHVHLARSATRVSSVGYRTTFQFARALELTYFHCDRDKHFDWYDSLHALVSLHPTAAVTIVSRWADRRFGRPDRILPATFDKLVRTCSMPARVSIALSTLDEGWLPVDALAQSLDEVTDRVERERVWEAFRRYAPFRDTSASTYERVRGIVEHNRLPTDEVEEWRGNAEQRHRNHTGSTYLEGVSRREAKDLPLKVLPSDFDVTDASAIAMADEAIADDDYRTRDAFRRELFEKVPIGREGQFLRALRSSGVIEYASVRDVLGMLPKHWRNRLSTVAAVREFVVGLYRDLCDHVSPETEWAVMPIDLGAEIAGMPPADLSTEVLDALGQRPPSASAESLFRTAALLARALSARDALDALEYGLRRFDDVLTNEDGDGPWCDDFAPPDDMTTALGGYIWRALCDADVRHRWRAAHCVRTLCLLGLDDLLGAVLKFAESQQPEGAFFDPGLERYQLHGVQWLLFALHRAALESPEIVASCEAFLHAKTTPECRHVLFRHLAARTLLALADTGTIAMDPEDRARLVTINATLRTEPETPDGSTRSFPLRNMDKWRTNERFDFPFRFGENYTDRLASIFGIPGEHMDDAVAQVIRDDWQWPDNAARKTDARHARGLIEQRGAGRDGPDADDTATYLSHHATMVAAGALVASIPTAHDDGEWFTFPYWLKGYLPSLGNEWLFDRRFPVPVDCRDLALVEADEWLDALPAGPNYALDIAGTDRIAVGGSWSVQRDRRRMRVSIESSLVSLETAPALVRAFSLARNPYDYAMPNCGDDSEIDDPYHTLKGWLVLSTPDPEADRSDPWANDMTPWTLRPPRELVDRLALQHEWDRQRWRHADDTVAYETTMWTDREGERSNWSDGQRATASRAMIEDLCAATGLALLIEVRTRHELTDYRGRSAWNDERSERSATDLILFRTGRDPVIQRTDPSAGGEDREGAR